MTDQNNPSFGQAPQQPPAAPMPAQQAFGDAPPPPEAPGEATFGAAPSAPPSAGETFGAAPAPVKKKGGVAKIIGSVVALVAILIAVGVGLAKGALFGGDPTKEAQAGDCIGNLPEVAAGEDKEANDAKVVACTDAAAVYKVEGRLENKTVAEAESAEICAAYSGAEYVYRAIDDGSGKGYVLCLSAVKK